MIRKDIYLYAVLLCLTWTGCSRTTDADDPSEPVPVMFSAVPFRTSTRAMTGGESFANGTKVTIYGVSQGTADYAASQWTDTPFMNNKTATVGADGKLTYSPVQFFPNGDKYSFFSVFKGKSGENGVSIAAAADAMPPVLTVSLQATPSSQADVMTATAKNETKVTARNGMTFMFTHLLTQVRFNIAKAATYTKVANLTKVTANTYTEASTSIDNTDLTVNTTGGKVDIEFVDYAASPLVLTEEQQTLVQAGDTKPAYAMLFPGDANRVTFTFTINGRDYPLILDETWIKGTIYTYDITFDKDLKLIVTGWSTLTWETIIGGSSVLDASEWDEGGTLNKEVL